MKKIINFWVSIIFVFSLFSSSLTPVFATEIIDDYNSLIIVSDSKSKSEAIKKFNNLFKSNKTFFKKGDYDFNTLKVVDYEGYKVASMSIKRNTLSTITITLNETDNYVFETYVYNENGNFSFKNYLNGELYHSEKTNIKYLNESQVKKGIKELRQYNDLENNGLVRPSGLDLTCFGAVSGAGGGVALLISKLCGTPCILTPPVCVACLGGIILVGSGSVIGAVWACWK